jgi:ribonucleoside-diphosphate reductase subunit M2
MIVVYMSNETILIENPHRFVLFPIQYHKTWDMYKKAQKSTWFAEEIDFTDDITHYKKLSDDEKYFINNVLAFFASSDGIVNENLMKNLMEQAQVPEIRAFYAHQMFIETIHNESYSLMIDVLVNSDEKNKLFKAITEIPIITKMSDWSLKWLNSEKSFSQKMIAFACIEGIMFSGPFCAIYWLKKRGLMPGLSFANELISRDEGLHCDFAVHVYNDLIKHKESYETILEIFKEAVELEIEFINDSLPCSLIGMNKDMMKQYIEFVADRLLSQLNYPKHWNVSNPFDWMDLISMDTKTNFFEKRVSR